MKHTITISGRNAALFSLIFGGSLTLLFLMTGFEALAFIGFFHLFPTILVHGIILLLIIINLLKYPHDYKEHLFVIFMMLLNIPIAFGCAFVVFSYGLL